MSLTLLALVLLLTGCAGLDSVGTDSSRTDSVHLQFAVQSLPYDELIKACVEWPAAAACTTETGVYVQGAPKRTIIRLKVQYLSWAGIGEKCGRFRGVGSCYEHGTLYTSSLYTDDFHVAGIGDILNESFNLGLGFNHAATLGHEFQHHILSNTTH